MSRPVLRRSFLQAGSAALVSLTASRTTAGQTSEKSAGGVPKTSSLPVDNQVRRPWWNQEEPLRFLDLATAFGRVSSLSPAEITVGKAAQFYNAEHLHVMDVSGGLDDQDFYFSTKLAVRQNEDYLRRYLPEAKKQGLRVFIYFDVHWFKRAFGDKHSDWLQIREDGGPITSLYGGPATSFCMNSPWREWVFQVLRDLCAYPIDGIFYDGPGFRPDTCYCRYCQESFLKEYGRKLPSKKKRQGKDARDLVEFQVNSQVRFLRHSRQVIKAINPEIALYKNGGVRGGNWATGRMNRALVAEQDLLGSEGGYIGREITDVPHHFWKPGLTARLLETQGPDKPRVIFSNSRHGPWTFSVLPAPELRLLYADTVANAANAWFAASPSDLGRPEMEALSNMNRFVAKNSAYYRGTRSEAAVALVWSDTTANFYEGSDAQMLDIEKVAARSEVGNLDKEFSGLADAVLRSQTPFDVIDDVTLEQEKLDRYAAIFLPNVACMSEKSARRLKDYVRAGGNLFATFETSLYDDTGRRRPDFALAEMFGARHGGKIAGPNRWDYMRPVRMSSLLKGWPREFVPAPVYHVRVMPDGGRILAQYMKPLAGSYAGIPEPSDEPALVAHRYGQGQAIYFSGDLGNALDTYRFGEFFGLIENVLREIAPSPVVLENAPRSLEVVLRSQEERRLLLHLVNFTGEMTRPMRRVLPLENVRITLRTKGEVKSVHTLMRAQTLATRSIGGEQVQFSVPRIEEYEVVVLEK